MSLDLQTNLRAHCEEMGDYVADLQLHMTLQARKLIPNLSVANDNRDRLLHETQAASEKYISRQSSL